VGLQVYDNLLRGVPEFEQRRLYINYAKDFLYLRRINELYQLQRELYLEHHWKIEAIKSRIQHLIIDEDAREIFKFSSGTLASFCTLETLVMERPPGAWYGRDFDMKWAWKRMSRKYKRRFKIKVVQPELRINSTAEIAAWPR
jgi:hypothetical protein